MRQLFLFFFWFWRRSALRRLTRPLSSAALFGDIIVVTSVLIFLTRPPETFATPPVGIPPSLEGAPNVILIGVATLRAARLSSYGYTESETPHIEALAADGVRYTEMTAQASWTKPSFATIFTSLAPSSHTATGKPHRLPQAVPTLAEALAASGYYLIYNVATGVSELYELDTEPSEQQERTAEAAQVAERLKSEWLDWMAYTTQIARDLPRTSPPADFDGPVW